MLYHIFQRVHIQLIVLNIQKNAILTSLRIEKSRTLDLLSDEVKKFIKYNNGRSIIYYEPYFKLCSNETELCKVYLKNNKQLFFRDPTHLTIQGSKYLSDHFDNYLIKTLKLN